VKGESLSLPATPPRQLAAYEAPRWLRDGETVPFRKFASDGQSRLSGAGSAKLYFRLAPDLHFATRSMVPLRASFRWRRIPGSTPARLRVTLNGTLVARRSFRGPKAGETIQETLQVPVSALYPRNTLTFELEYPELPASVRPEFEIDMDSALDLRDVEHFTEMPRLDLFAKAASRSRGTPIWPKPPSRFPPTPLRRRSPSLSTRSPSSPARPARRPPGSASSPPRRLNGRAAKTCS
jgi:hypothetical protein